jgi:SGNH domain (fused to AT3 domains)
LACCLDTTLEQKRDPGWGIVAAFSASFSINVLRVRSDPVATFYLPFGRFWELLVGGAIAHMALHHQASMARWRSENAIALPGATIRISDLASMVGLLAIIWPTFEFSEFSAFPGWLALLPVSGAALLVAAGDDGWVNRRLLSARASVAIGLISYPLYLWHWPLLFFGRMTSFGDDHSRVITLAMVGLAFALSVLTYLVIEKPLRFGFPGKRGTVAGALSTVMALLGALGLATYAAGGWKDRFPNSFRPFLDYSYDYETSFRDHKCLLGGPERQFAEECAGHIDSAGTVANQLLLIWGDSHGAMLYRALDELSWERGDSVAQYTSSSCPPIIGFDKADRPLCHAINDSIYQRVKAIRPPIVLLAHDWPQSIAENSLAGLPGTEEALRGSGVRRIILLGPVPHWVAALQHGAGAARTWISICRPA